MLDGRDVCSLTPHADIENNYKRNVIEYSVDFPDDGLSDDTGLIFTVSGYGFSTEHPYEVKLS